MLMVSCVQTPLEGKAKAEMPAGKVGNIEQQVNPLPYLSRAAEQSERAVRLDWKNKDDLDYGDLYTTSIAVLYPKAYVTDLKKI